MLVLVLPSSTVGSVKFPSNMGHNSSEKDPDKRDSCISNVSNSSYESTDTTSISKTNARKYFRLI
jgi:hypothetical protein